MGRLTLNAGVRWDRYKGWLPEQNQLGAIVGPVVVQAKTSPRPIFTWNQVAPRVGAVFDLTGDGRTVVKGNYGLLAQPGCRRSQRCQSKHRHEDLNVELERPGQLCGMYQRRQALAARRGDGDLDPGSRCDPAGSQH